MAGSARVRRALAALATVPVALGTAACTSGGAPATTPTPQPSSAPTATPGPAPDPDAISLDVEVQGWNGWQEEQPSPQTSSQTIDDGATFEVQTVSGPITFTVVEIADDRIDLETDGPLVVTDQGGVDFDDATTTFAIDRPGPLTLTTPTMDGGTDITLTVEEG